MTEGMSEKVWRPVLPRLRVLVATAAACRSHERESRSHEGGTRGHAIQLRYRRPHRRAPFILAPLCLEHTD